jgi:hypothetical protein
MRFHPVVPSFLIDFLWTGLLLIAPAQTLAASQRFGLELEAGPVWQGRNEVQIPNDAAGSRFSLVDLTGNGPFPALRLTFDWQFRERHALGVVLAPLSYTETGRFGEPVRFVGETYEPDRRTEATYEFNSWRLTYRYRFFRGSRWRWWVGFTGKLRDAKIRLEQAGTTSQDTDLGFVPLLHLRGACRLAERWRFLIDLDALAGGPGRAEDLALKLARDLSSRWMLAIGYRTLEGGADTEEVYNFAWLHYAVVSLGYRF